MPLLLVGSLAGQKMEGCFQINWYHNCFVVPGLSYDPISDTVWVAIYEGLFRRIQRYSRSGRPIAEFPIPRHPLSINNEADPSGMDCDRRRGTLWLADWGGQVIYEVGPDGLLTNRGFRTPASHRPVGIALDPETDSCYSLDWMTQHVAQYRMDGLSLRSFSYQQSGMVTPRELAYDKLTRTLWLTERDGKGNARLFQIDLTGQKLGVWNLTQLLNLPYVTLGPDLDTRTGRVFVVRHVGRPAVCEISGILPACGQGAITPYGAGCPDSSNTLVPTVTCTDCPTVGRELVIGHQGSSATSGAAIYVLGTQRTPMNLAGLGAPKCDLLVLPVILEPATITNGRGAFALPIPDVAALKGGKFDVQALVFEASWLSATGGLELILQ